MLHNVPHWSLCASTPQSQFIFQRVQVFLLGSCQAVELCAPVSTVESAKLILYDKIKNDVMDGVYPLPCAD